MALNEQSGSRSAISSAFVSELCDNANEQIKIKPNNVSFGQMCGMLLTRGSTNSRPFTSSMGHPIHSFSF